MATGLGGLLGGAGLGGGVIGQAIVQLELDSKKYTAEMDAAKAKTTASTSAMGTSTSRFGSLASTAFLAAGAAAVYGLGLSVKAALEAQEAHERLANTVQNAAQLSQDSVAHFEAQAEAIRSVTGADDEAIISGQALLGQMGLTEDQIISLTPLVVDLASKFNIDLNTAFKAAGKAALGNTGTLARYVGTVKAGSTAAETFSNVLVKLGGAEGFAADRAKHEPWLILKSDMQEISEDIGKALLPALQSLADSIRNLMPLIEGLAKAIRYLPLFQMSEDIGATDSAVTKFVNGLIDSIPVLGSYVDLDLGHPFRTLDDALQDALVPMPKFADAARAIAAQADDAGQSVVGAGHKIHQFAHMTAAELHDWQTKISESFDTSILKLQDLSTETGVTSLDFMHATQRMRRAARDLADALEGISKEDWVPDAYVQFLSEQGPDWLVAFAGLTETQQHRAVTAWEATTRKTDDAKESLENITGALETIEKTDAKGTVTIEYKYVGFDPTKPGMSGAGTGQGHATVP